MSFFKSIKKRDPAARNIIQIILCYPGVHALFFYRISRILYILKLKLLAEFIMFLVRVIYSIEIHPAAIIKKRLFIDHGCGVVIGATAIIGNDVTIYHSVTLGANKLSKGKRHPTIGNNVVLGAGSMILGDIIIGDNSVIGANATVTKDVLPNSVVIGAKSELKIYT